MLDLFCCLLWVPIYIYFVYLFICFVSAVAGVCPLDTAQDQLPVSDSFVDQLIQQTVDNTTNEEMAASEDHWSGMTEIRSAAFHFYFTWDCFNSNLIYISKALR